MKGNLRLMGFLLLFLQSTAFQASGQEPKESPYTISCDTLKVLEDLLSEEDSTTISQKHPWHAAGEIGALNLAILSFDHYILDADFSHVTWHTIEHNLSPHSWYWDSDFFRTNLMEHPYHGSLYFNIARSNHLSFYQSIPYAFGGSLLWELAGESEQPSINDFLSTSFGGIAIGEASHRISEQIYDESLIGGSRVVREVLGALINPISGINRIINGRAWHVKHRKGPQRNIPLSAFITLYGRHWGSGHHHRYGAAANIQIETGSLKQPIRHPYDFCRVSVGAATGQPESFISNLNVLGRLYGWEVYKRNHNVLSAGIFQHFDYYATDTIGSTPIYKLAEAASIGGGLCLEHLGRNTSFQWEFYANTILLGGVQTDYIHVPNDRGYSVGSGYSINNIISFEWFKRVNFCILSDMKHLFSWHGYEDEDNNKPYLTYSVMGHHGNTWICLLQPEIAISLSKHWNITCSAMWVFRNSHYKYNPNVFTTSHDIRLGLSYSI